MDGGKRKRRHCERSEAIQLRAGRRARKRLRLPDCRSFCLARLRARWIASSLQASEATPFFERLCLAMTATPSLVLPFLPPWKIRRHVLRHLVGEARRTLFQERRHAFLHVRRGAADVDAAAVHL